jgi:uncharacterized protein (TIGR00251 family)
MPVIEVKVKPHAKVSRLVELSDGTFLAEVKAPPVDGKANQELVRLIARHFDCPPSHVSVKLGGSSRRKLVAVGE